MHSTRSQSHDDNELLFFDNKSRLLSITPPNSVAAAGNDSERTTSNGH
jgi:hypothetical protein